MKVSDVMDGVWQIIRDQINSAGDDYRILKNDQALVWYNDALRYICLNRPDASALVESFELDTGKSLQSLPSGRTRLLGLNVNLGADGTTVGKAITGPVPQEEMDALDPEWRTRAGSFVRQYVYNEDTPQHYYVYPLVATPWYVEGRFSTDPTTATDLGDTVSIADVYAPVLTNLIASRVFQRDDEHSPNWTRAGALWKLANDALGIKTTADKYFAPARTEQG